MKKSTSVLLSLLAVGAMTTAAQADVNKGQKAYLKTCKKCHGNGTKGAGMHTQDEWTELFEDGAMMMIDAHSGTKAEPFFNGKRFKSLAPHLKDFLHNYASDSGNVPSCG